MGNTKCTQVFSRDAPHCLLTHNAVTLMATFQGHYEVKRCRQDDVGLLDVVAQEAALRPALVS